MPRIDRSFTGKDVVRIAIRNLSEEELVFVIQELCRGVRDLPVPAEEAIEEIEIEELISSFTEIGQALFDIGLSAGDLIRTLLRRL